MSRNIVGGIFAFVLAFCGVVHAQVAQSTVVGRIQDTTGAVIANVAVQMTMESTGEIFKGVTTQTGDYTLPNLPVGSYELRTSANGFKTELRTGITLEVGRTYRFDFTLSPGQVVSVTEVTAEAPLLNTESPEASQVIDNQKIVDLPLNGRDVVGSLAALAPGITPAAGSRIGANTFGSYNIRGNRVEDTLVLVDGSMLSQDNGVMTYVQGPDSVQEFEIKTGLYGAEYGIRPGGVISLVTKSGTNMLHGTAFDFLRNGAADAKNYFDRGARPPFQRNQYGATAGGPIYIPGVFNGKDKAWWFFSFQGQRQNEFSPLTGVVPTDAQRSGVFTDTIIDPETGQPFQNNTIPSDRINSISQQFLQFWPEPNTSGALNFTCYTCSIKDNRAQTIAKVDFKTSEKDRWSARFIWDSFPIRHLNPIQIFSRIDPLSTWAQNLVNTHTFSPTIVNEVGLHYFRRPYSPGYGPASGSPQNFDSTLGLPNFPRSASDAQGVLDLTVPGYLAVGDSLWHGKAPIGDWEIKDDLSVDKGAHSLRLGYEYRRNFTYNTFSLKSSVSFSSRYTGDAFADFLLGDLTSASLGADTYFGVMNEGAHFLYFQDHWRATNKLTLDLGVRYEHRDAWEDSGGYSANFNPITGQMNPPFQDVVPPSGQTGRYAANVPLVTFSPKMILPRVGLAYALTPKTVVRAGFGIYGNEPYFNHYWFLGGNPRVNASLATANGDLLTPTLSMSDPFSAAASSSIFNVYGIQSPLPTQQTQEWGLSIQRQLSQHDVFDISYQGTHAIHEINNVSLNDAPPGAGLLQPRRPYTQYGTISEYTANANGSYNGLEAKYERKAGSNGLSMLVAFTFAKSIDEGEDETMTGNLPASFNRGRSQASIPGRLVITPGYRSPFGSHGSYLTSGAAGKILGDWNLLGIFTWQAGGYITAVMPSDSLNVGSTASFRPDLVGDPTLSGSQRSLQEWFNTSAFAAPADFTYGNSSRGAIQGPGLVNVDIAVLRDFRVGERTTLQFRFESFNVANHANFLDPGTTFGTSSFGVIGSAYDPRELQIALKVLF